MAPLQKRALFTLIIGFIFAITLIVVFLLEGDVTAFNRDETFRWIVYAALIGAPLTYLILIDLTLRKPSQLDERDRLILERSGRVQWVAVIFSLAAWMITLTEVFQEQRVIELPDFLVAQSDLPPDVNADPATAHAMTFGLSLGEIERVTERTEQFGEAHVRRGGHGV